MSDAPVNDRVVFRGAYVVANGVLCLSFLLLTALASRVIWRGELSTWRLKLFFGFVLASVIVRAAYFLAMCVVYLAAVTPDYHLTLSFYLLFWLPQLFTLIPFISLFFWWLDIFTSTRNWLIFSDFSLRKRYIVGEVTLVILLCILQFGLFFFSLLVSDDESRAETFLTIDGQSLGAVQLGLALLALILIVAFAIACRAKGLHLVRTGPQLHFTIGVWIIAFIIQGLITILARFLQHFRVSWYDVNDASVSIFIGDALYCLCEWLPMYFILEEKFRSRVKSYTFDLSDLKVEDDFERMSLLDGIAKKMTKIIPRSDLYIGERTKIGEGSFGVVYKGMYNGDPVAIKVIKYTEFDVGFVEEFCKELQVLSTLAHPNIVRFIGACVERPDISIVMEYIPRGSLRKILDDPHITLTHDIIVKMARGVAEAMQYLHRMNIVHRDLKSDNMLVGNDWVIKVTDFGLAKLMDRTKEANEKMTRNVGTLAWVAPEILEKGVSYTEKVDVYSFGVVVWEMLTKGIPYQGEDNISRAIAAGERPPIPLDCPDFFRKLISKCWLQVPEKRPSFEQIVDYLSRWQKLDLDFWSEPKM